MVSEISNETQLRPSAPSASTSFVASCPPGQLDPVGKAPVPKMHMRPTSSQRHKKPSALDKHLRHVTLLQRFIRYRAQHNAATAQHKHMQRQRFAHWSHTLRSAILGRAPGSSTDMTYPSHIQSRPHMSHHDTVVPQHHSSSARHDTGPAAGPAVASYHKQQAANDIIQSWRPAAAAERVHKLQQQNLEVSLPNVLNPETPQPGKSLRQQQLSKPCSTRANTDTQQQPANCLQAADTSEVDGLDVEAFLDGLLCTAEAAKGIHSAQADTGDCTAGSPNPRQRPQLAAQKQQPHNEQQKQRPSSSCSTRKPLPAWALSEQQQAAAEASAAEQEEQQLLNFAEDLDWLELRQDLGDEQLTAAFQELGLAEAAAAGGLPDADKRWQHCFVTALNAAAMKGISDNNTAAPAAILAAGSRRGDQHSAVTSASTIRQAQAAAARRQQLIQRLRHLTGDTAGLTSAAGPGTHPSAPSVCGSSSSRLGSHTAAEVAGSNAGLAVGAHPTAGRAVSEACQWDSSTAVSSGVDDVGRLRAAIKHLEAGEVLAENPEMRVVHSTASVRHMLSKLERETSAPRWADISNPDGIWATTSDPEAFWPREMSYAGSWCCFRASFSLRSCGRRLVVCWRDSLQGTVSSAKK